MKKIIATILILINISNSFAQLPNTDIWLLDIIFVKDSIILSNPVNITKRVGYDNQPAFSPDGKYILFTSIHDDKQSDIYKFDLKSKSTSQFTKTATSEYSPTFMPDGKNISVVMVEPDSAQRLWKFPLNGGKPSVILEKFDSIGYHCWFQGYRAAVYLLTEPNSLQLISKNYSSPRFVDDSIGRCINYLHSMLCYTKKTVEGLNQFCFFNLPGWKIEKTTTIIESEDYAFYGGNKVVYGFGNKLYYTYLNWGKEKELIQDLSVFGIKNISRITFNPDYSKLAIVAESK